MGLFDFLAGRAPAPVPVIRPAHELPPGAVELYRPPPNDRSAPTGQDLPSALAAAHAAAQLTAAADPRVAGASSTGMHPVLQITQRLPGSGTGHHVQLAVFALLREYLPILDAAIGNRRTLEGALVVESDDPRLSEEMNAWLEEIPVGYLGGRATQRGLNLYLDLIADSADEFGLGVGEMLISENARAIERLVVPSARVWLW